MQDETFSLILVPESDSPATPARPAIPEVVLLFMMTASTNLFMEGTICDLQSAICNYNEYAANLEPK